MLSSVESDAITKKRIEPRLATGRYDAHATSISSPVARASTSFSLISVALVLVFSSVSMSSVLSRMLPVALASS